MICDSNSNVWVIEPGRGNICIPADSTPFYVMTNGLLRYLWYIHIRNIRYIIALIDILGKDLDQLH